MKLNRTPNPLDRNTRNSDNENWDIIEGEFKKVDNTIGDVNDRVDNIIDEVSDDALKKVVDNAKLNWKEPVDNFSDLPSNAQKGDTRMDRSTGKVYRYDGTKWVEIQQIDARPVNEVDARLTSQINETYSISPSVISGYWKPPTVPSAMNKDQPSWANGTWKYNKFIDELYEPQRIANPNYITRDNLGKDASGTYNIYAYKLEPEKYEKTMIIVSGVHGGEKLTMYTLAYFYKLLVDNWKDSPQLSYLRNKVRLIIVPIANPWGQDNRTRYNSNGVDLNRNAGYKWNDYPMKEPFETEYKGTEPFSESETQILRDLLEQYKDATTFVDMHAYGAGGQHYMFNTPMRKGTDRDIFIDVANFMRTPSFNKTHFMEMDSPMIMCYAAHAHGMHSMALESPGTGVYDEDILGSVSLTKSLEWQGNIIMQFARHESKGMYLAEKEPFFIRTNFVDTSTKRIIIPRSNTYINVDELELKFRVPSNGIVVYRGEIVIYGTNNNETLSYFCPTLKQSGRGSDFTEDNQEGYWEIYGGGGQYQTIPFSAEIPVTVYSTQEDNEVVAGLMFKRTETGSGEMRLARFRGVIEFIPTYNPAKLKRYSATNRSNMNPSYSFDW